MMKAGNRKDKEEVKIVDLSIDEILRAIYIKSEKLTT